MLATQRVAKAPGDLLEPALRGTDFLRWYGTGEDDMAALEACKAAVPFDIMRHELYERSQKLIPS